MRKQLRAWVALALLAWSSACAAPAPTLGDPSLDAGREVFGRFCSSCHGGSGGGGSGPALTEVLDTFPDCETHLRWVTIGGRRWIEEVGPTYGPTGKTITGVMPSFEATLTPEQVAQVTAFERVQFGGGTSEQVLADCGLG